MFSAIRAKLCRCLFDAIPKRKEFLSSNYLRISRLTVSRDENNIHDKTNIYFSSEFFSSASSVITSRRGGLLFRSKRTFLFYSPRPRRMTLRQNNEEEKSQV